MVKKDKTTEKTPAPVTSASVAKAASAKEIAAAGDETSSHLPPSSEAKIKTRTQFSSTRSAREVKEEKTELTTEKAAAKKEDSKKEEKEKAVKYYEAVGRRKTAIARVRLFSKGDKTFVVNDKNLENYFSTKELQSTAKSSLERMNILDKFGVSAKVKGGGINAQAEAVRLGTARALVDFNADFRKRLKRAGFLTRDPRMKERKKPGLKRARKAPQWAKR